MLYRHRQTNTEATSRIIQTSKFQKYGNTEIAHKETIGNNKDKTNKQD